ncbi:hypothetical protein NC652_024257 [Populus alba x Populus x berolinensis]|nr:hypothetical protein NC652_024257 [Populus alba x Populus x berolinensis]
MVHLCRMSSKAALYMPTHADRWRELERKRDERDQLLPTVQSITALGEVNKERQNKETENRGQPPFQLPQTICLQEFARERRYNTILIYFFNYLILILKLMFFFSFPVNGSVFLSVEFHVKN